MESPRKRKTPAQKVRFQEHSRKVTPMKGLKAEVVITR